MVVINVFTDGACSNQQNRSKARASWSAYFPEYPHLSCAGLVAPEETQTNQRGELKGILEAIKVIEANFPVESDIHIFTDSMYSKNCLTTWLQSWIANNWRTKQGGHVCHRDLIESISNKLSRFNSFIITHVEAHTGGDDYNSINNDKADQLAVNALKGDSVGQTSVPVVQTNTQVPLEGFPTWLMGPPISEANLYKWCQDNLDKIKPEHLKTGILGALTKTVKSHGFDLVKQKLHRSVNYRLHANHLISESNDTINEDEH